MLKTTVWYAYALEAEEFMIAAIKVIIANLMFAFAFFELLPFFKKLEFDKSKLFFGGLAEDQGALRSAFLIKCGFSKENFITTWVMISSVIDISRV